MTVFTLLQGRWAKSIQEGHFGTLDLHNPWTDLVKIWHDWLRPPSDPTRRNSRPTKGGWGGVGIWVQLYHCVLFGYISLWSGPSDLWPLKLSVLRPQLHLENWISYISFVATFYHNFGQKYSLKQYWPFYHTYRSAIYDFLLTLHSNHGPIS